MKKVKLFLLLGLVLSSLFSVAQKKNKLYELYYYDSIYRKLHNTDVLLRNDTLYIGPTAPANVISVIKEDLKTFISIPLGMLRDTLKREPNAIKKNSSKKSK